MASTRSQRSDRLGLRQDLDVKVSTRTSRSKQQETNDEGAKTRKGISLIPVSQKIDSKEEKSMNKACLSKMNKKVEPSMTNPLITSADKLKTERRLRRDAKNQPSDQEPAATGKRRRSSTTPALDEAQQRSKIPSNSSNAELETVPVKSKNKSIERQTKRRCVQRKQQDATPLDGGSLAASRSSHRKVKHQSLGITDVSTLSSPVSKKVIESLKQQGDGSPNHAERDLELPDGDAGQLTPCERHIILPSDSMTPCEGQQRGEQDVKALMSGLQLTGDAFDPSCKDHVTAVKNILAISGCRSHREMAPEGRQQQYQQLYNTLTSCCNSGQGRSIYISGLPGTGKSHTVSRVISKVTQEQEQAPVCVTINCMALADCKDVYAVLLAECELALMAKDRSDARMPPSPAVPNSTASHGGVDAAHSALIRFLQTNAYGKQRMQKKGGATVSHPGPLLVLVLEEVDRLLSKGPDEVYRLFMLPHNTGVRVVLVTIANSLDLTERMLPALKCRGASPDFLCFPAYSKSQVQNILTSTLAQLPWRVFEDLSLELVARTVSGSTGDLRHAFKVCRTALETLVEGFQQHSAAAVPSLAVAAPVCHTVGLREMAPAVKRLTNAGGSQSLSSVATIKALPNQQQLVLLALSMEIAGADAAGVAIREAEEAGVSAASVSYAAARAKKNVNPFAESAAPGGLTPGGKGLSADAALRVPVNSVYNSYCGLCKQLFMRPVSTAEFMHTCVLLSEQALVQLIGGGAATGGGRGRGGMIGGTPGSSHVKAKISLRVLAKDVRSALQGNPIYKKVIGA